MSWFTVKTRSFTGGQPRHHKIKLPDHARVHTSRTWRRHYKLYNFIVAERGKARKCPALSCMYFVAAIFFVRYDATQRYGWPPPRFISRTRDYRGRVRCVERVTNSVRRARHRLKYLCRKHRNLVNGPASYESRFICAFANIVPGHRRTWRTKNANVRKNINTWNILIIKITYTQNLQYTVTDVKT